METLTTSSEHRRHDAAASTDSTPPHGQYRGGAALSNTEDVAMVGETLAPCQRRIIRDNVTTVIQDYVQQCPKLCYFSSVTT